MLKKSTLDSVFIKHTSPWHLLTFPISMQLHSTKPDEEATNVEPEEDSPVSDAELQKLRDLLKQRDDEISVLLKMLKQEKRRAAGAEATLKRSGVQHTKSSSPILGRTSPLQVQPGTPPLGAPSLVHKDHQENVREPQSQEGRFDRRNKEQRGVQRYRGYVSSTQSRDSIEWRAAMKAELSQARQEAFDMFRKNVADMSSVDQHKRVLKAK